MSKTPYEDVYISTEENRNVVKQEVQDTILEMMIHYNAPSTDESLWRDMFDEYNDKKTIRNTYTNI